MAKSGRFNLCLDIWARENIERALAEYPGAIIYATHDEVLAQMLGADKQGALSTSGQG